jgi:single-strand DNA-binding protein
MSFHTVIIVGNLGKDPEMRYTPSGQAVTSFSLASGRKYTNSNGQTVNETIWFRVSAWGKSAETCNNYLHKGSKVLVEGRLVPGENGSPRIFTRGDGTSGASFEISASTVRFLTPKGEGEAGMGEDADSPAEEGEIPF